jgi:hypothetical protein
VRKLTSEEKIQKILNHNPVDVYIVEVFYGYGPESKSAIGKFFKDEVLNEIQEGKLDITADTCDDGVILKIHTREAKNALLNSALESLTSPSLTRAEISVFQRLCAKRMASLAR